MKTPTAIPFAGVLMKVLDALDRLPTHEDRLGVLRQAVEMVSEDRDIDHRRNSGQCSLCAVGYAAVRDAVNGWGHRDDKGAWFKCFDADGRK